MRNIRIVADSSSNILELKDVIFANAPLKIIADGREFVDDAFLDVEEMIDFFDNYKGKSQTSCPNPSDWLAAFGDADEVFCVTITSGLSGSFNTACAAKQMYESENSGKRVCVLDSLSAGPELMLVIERLETLIAQGLEYDDICTKIKEYMKSTSLYFILSSLKNFAANGRVSPTVAKIVGVLGIRIVGKASDAGQLEPLNKCRGEDHSIATLMNYLRSSALPVGKVRIAHCRNEAAAVQLKTRILNEFPGMDVDISSCRGLCSYYAEKGGILVAFEEI